MTPVELLYIVVVIIALKYHRYHCDQGRCLLYSLGVIEQSQTERWDFADRKLALRHAIRELEDRDPDTSILAVFMWVLIYNTVCRGTNFDAKPWQP